MKESQRSMGDKIQFSLSSPPALCLAVKFQKDTHFLQLLLHLGEVK